MTFDITTKATVASIVRITCSNSLLQHMRSSSLMSNIKCNDISGNLIYT